MQKILLGKGEQPCYINLNMLNRHGIIAGATGTGKTVTLKVLSESLAQNGVPVFLSDIKGDLSNLIQAGQANEKIIERAKNVGIENFEPKGFNAEFFDVLGKAGVPIRASISDMGPVMISKLLGLNDVQSGILNITFKIADDNGMLLEDLKDLRAMLNYVVEHKAEYTSTYGNISTQSTGAILRSLLVLEEQGANNFFGEPSFDIRDFFNQDENSNGIINILNATKLFQNQGLYATFLFWLLSELYENLPEVGDLDKPKIVFFFDEAHTLFKNNSPALLEKIELIVRLIRSKGVGIFFVTQNPTDIPDAISSQLGTRIQHGLRAFSPKELKAVKSIAQSLRSDDEEKIKQLITNLGVGEAVVSTLNDEGIPTFAQKITIRPPQSSFENVDISDLQYKINNSSLNEKYLMAKDNYSAYEKISDMKKSEQQELLNEKKSSKKSQAVSRRTDSGIDRFTKNVMSSIGREVGRQIIRGIFGNRR
nr:helicase HerA-like domain-containing protein [uncultured Criibacterium sp.]